MSADQLQAGPDSAMLAQILVTTTQTQTDVAVMKEQLKAVPDHEARIREIRAEVPPNLIERLSAIETGRAKMMGAVTLLGALSGSAGGAIIGWALTHR